MHFIIGQDIPQIWQDSFREFERDYTTSFHKLDGKDIEIKVASCVESDENNPLQTNVTDESISYTDTAIDLGENERKALIAHELGHFINKHLPDGVDLEMACDQVAVGLGLSSSLLSTLQKLREKMESQRQDFTFLIDFGDMINRRNEESLDSIKKRIKTLQVKSSTNSRDTCI